MRLLPALLLAIGLVAPAASAQDPKLEEILSRMASRAEGIQDVSFKIDQKADANWGMPVQADIAVTWLKDTGLRLRATSEMPMEMPVATMPRSFDVIYTSDSIRIMMEYGSS